jgi:hypothetical protein
VTWTVCGQDLEANLRDLHARVRQGRFRAKPSRRVYITPVRWAHLSLATPAPSPRWRSAPMRASWPAAAPMELCGCGASDRRPGRRERSGRQARPAARSARHLDPRKEIPHSATTHRPRTDSGLDPRKEIPHSATTHRPRTDSGLAGSPPPPAKSSASNRSPRLNCSTPRTIRQLGGRADRSGCRARQNTTPCARTRP